MQRHVFPSADSHAQLQPVQAIQPADAFAIHQPALPPQQHPDSQIPKPRPGMGEIPNAHPERRLILGSTLSIPRARPNCAKRQARRQLT